MPAVEWQSGLLDRRGNTNEGGTDGTRSGRAPSPETLPELAPAPLVGASAEPVARDPAAAVVMTDRSAQTIRPDASVELLLPAPIFAPTPAGDSPPLDPSATDRRVRAATGESRAALHAPLAAASRSEEPNEVHVHIGRIEVTAVREAPPARRKRSQGKPPMSLGEYLAKRQRSDG